MDLTHVLICMLRGSWAVLDLLRLDPVRALHQAYMWYANLWNIGASEANHNRLQFARE